MDPSIMQLLEEDEDESMHSGADVEAFTAALNRDIEGGSSTCQPSQSETSAFSQENSQTSSQMYSQWQLCMQDNTTVNHSEQQELRLQEKQEDQASQLETNEHASDVGIKKEVYDSHAPQNHQPHNMPIQGDVGGHQVEHNSGENSQSSASAQMQISGNAHAQVPVTDRNSHLSTGSQIENTQRFGGNQPASMTEQADASALRQKQIPSGSSADIEIKQKVQDSQAPQHHQPQNMPIQVDVKGHQVEYNFGQNSQSSASTQMQISGTAHSQISVTYRRPNPSTGSILENGQRFGGNQPVPMTDQAGALEPRQTQISFGSSPDVGIKQEFQDSQAPQHHHPQSMPVQVDVKGHQVEHNTAQSSQSSALTQMQKSEIPHAQIPVVYRSPNPSAGSKLENRQRFGGNQPAPITDQAVALAPRQTQISFGSSPGVGIKQEIQDSQAPQHHQQQNMSIQVDVKGHQVEHNSVHSSQSSASAQMQKLGSGHAQIPVADRKPNPTTGSQFTSMQRCSRYQPIPKGEQAGGSAPKQKQIPFGSLLPIIIPELDKDKAMQLQTLYNKLRRNEIPKETFVRLMRGIVGDQMLRLAVVKMQAKAQNPTQQERPSGPPTGAGVQYVDPNSLGQVHQKNQGTHPVPVTGPSQAPASANQPNTSGHQNIDSSAHRPGEAECMTDSQRMHANQMLGRPSVSIQGLTKEQQQHLHFSQSSFPVPGVNTPYSYTTSNISSPSTMVRPQPPVQLHQGSGPAHGDGTSQAVTAMNVSTAERQNSNDPNSVPAPTMPNMSTASMPQNAISLQPIPSKEQTFTSSTRTANIGGSSSSASLVKADTEMVNQSTSASPMSGTGGNSKTSATKSIIGQKKPLDADVSSPPLPSKKQKVSGGFAEQSIELLNDVTAVSGVNLREEEEQLFSLPKDDNRVSEASRRAVQEEEDRLILQKIPLQKKLAEILTKCGLQTLSNDVQRCLSLCVEKRLRALVSSLIRVSKQRADTEKSRHSVVVNSDVREHIMVVNRKAREEWDKKQAEAEKLRKQNEPDSSNVADEEREKDEGRAKTLKANKEDDDKMRTTAANVAARAAVGGDDMLSKWQLMAQARQKNDVGSETTVGSQVGKGATSKGSATLTRNVGDRRVAAKKDQSAAALRRSGAVRQSGRSQVTSPSTTVAPRISVKDIIAVLEREPQMAKSTLIYRLYNRLHTDSAT